MPAAALPPHYMYAMSEDGNIYNKKLLVMMLIAAVISFIAFSTTRYIFKSNIKRIIAGIIASYAAMLLILVVASSIAGEIAETLMWMPIILMFGAVYMAPLIGISLLGSVLVFGYEKETPEPPFAPDR